MKDLRRERERARTRPTVEERGRRRTPAPLPERFGALAVIRQRDADHYETVETIPTVKQARTCFFDPAGERLYLGVPRQKGEEGPTIRVYEPRP